MPPGVADVTQESAPIATYREVTFTSKRRIELFADRIRVSGSLGWSLDMDGTIPLRSIEPRKMTLRVRHPLCANSLGWGIAGLVTAIVLVSKFNFDPIGEAASLAWCVAISCLIGSLYTRKKIEYARFQSDAGAVMLDIGRSGPDKAQFDLFVELVMKQIHASRQTPSTPSGL
jgi:hypothetical protein